MFRPPKIFEVSGQGRSHIGTNTLSGCPPLRILALINPSMALYSGGFCVDTVVIAVLQTWNTILQRHASLLYLSTPKPGFRIRRVSKGRTGRTQICKEKALVSMLEHIQLNSVLLYQSSDLSIVCVQACAVSTTRSSWPTTPSYSSATALTRQLERSSGQSRTVGVLAGARTASSVSAVVPMSVLLKALLSDLIPLSKLK